MTKAELRKTYLSKRKELSAAERSDLSRRIADGFFANFDLASVSYLHCFLTIERFNEIDTSLIIERVWSEFPHVRTLIPKVNADTDRMEGLLFSPGTDLVQNEWGIREPAGGEVLPEEVVDLVIVPGICFDQQYHRVGYGKGYYDRFLAGCRPDCLKVGISYFPPVEAIPDIGAHDVALDYCLTPDRLFAREA
jgi:5-formyltetrahydrofolate cyclo-ligase